METAVDRALVRSNCSAMSPSGVPFSIRLISSRPPVSDQRMLKRKGRPSSRLISSCDFLGTALAGVWIISSEPNRAR